MVLVGLERLGLSVDRPHQLSSALLLLRPLVTLQIGGRACPRPHFLSLPATTAAVGGTAQGDIFVVACIVCAAVVAAAVLVATVFACMLGSFAVFVVCSLGFFFLFRRRTERPSFRRKK